MLAGLSRSSDANDLARTTLKNQKIANTDVMTGDSDGVRWTSALCVAGGAGSRHGDFAFFDDDVFLSVVTVVGSVDGMKYTIGSAVQSVAKRVVVTVLVVISHVTLVLPLWFDGSTGLRLDPNFLLDGGVVSVVGLPGNVPWVSGLVLLGRIVLLPTRWDVSGERSSALAEVSFSYVNVALENSGRTVSGSVFTVVRLVLDVDLCVGVPLVRLMVVLSLISLELDTSGIARGKAFFLVDVDLLFTSSWTAIAFFFVDSYFLFWAAVLTGTRDG